MAKHNGMEVLGVTCSARWNDWLANWPGMIGVFVSLSTFFFQQVLDVPMNYNLKKQHKRSESMGCEFWVQLIQETLLTINWQGHFEWNLFDEFFITILCTSLIF